MVHLASKKQFFMIFNRTDLRISLCGAKFDAEVDFDDSSAIAPPKTHQINENLISNTKKSIFFQKNFATIWGSPSVVGGWNFDSAQLSTSRTRQGARTMSEIDSF